MKRYEDDFTTAIFILVVTSLIILAGCFVKLSNIKNILQAQFDYEVEKQMCTQDAMEYLAPCHLERDEDGSYNWYFNPNEGRL